MKAQAMRQSAARNREVERSMQSISSVKPSEVSVGGATIEGFFKRRQQQLGKKQSRFAKVLDSKEFQSLANEANHSRSISKFSRFSKSSIKKQEQQLRRGIEQHKKMVAQLQGRMRSEEELNQFEKSLLREEKNRYLQKVQELQAEIEQLYRDNYRLRELDKSKQPVADSFQMGPLNEKSQEVEYKPYVIPTRNNDLNRINHRNIQQSKEKDDIYHHYDHPNPDDPLGHKLHKEKPISAGLFFNKRPNNFGLYHQKFPPSNEPEQQDNYILKQLLGSSFDHPHPQIPGAAKPPNGKNASHNASISSMGGNHFQTFEMANTLSFVRQSAVNESRQMVSMGSSVSTRNKVAFFKNSLVIVRDADVDIAFKRSEMNEALDKLRIIFYVNNKTSSRKSVSFNYDYQPTYFAIRVAQKLSTIQANTQGRQVVQVSLISKDDLNGVTDLHVTVGNTTYDLWLPANFIRFRTADRFRMTNDHQEMVLVPDRQFASMARMQEVAPLMAGGRQHGQQWAYLYGESRFGNFTIKLTWRQRELVIQSSDKWIDFLGFVLHFFK